MTERVLRPCRADDLPAVERIAAASVVGITALPPDRDKLREKILDAARSLEIEPGPGSGQYLFVLEDPATGRIEGVSGIVAAAGAREPFYSYRNEVIVHASQELGVSNRIHALHLCHDLTGHSLLTSFHIDTALRATAWPQLLSRARLLFMAEHPQRFADRLAAETPGARDADDRSPFWDAVGRRFFNMEFPLADRLSGGPSKTFIAELMPQYPIYVPLLPAAARDVIGRAHPVSQLPFSILLDEGFETGTYIDIFDGGPTVEARARGVRSIAGSRRLRVAAAENVENVEDAPYHLIANTATTGFRATIARAVEVDGELALTAETMRHLCIAAGGHARAIPL